MVSLFGIKEWNTLQLRKHRKSNRGSSSSGCDWKVIHTFGYRMNIHQVVEPEKLRPRSSAWVLRSGSICGSAFFRPHLIIAHKTATMRFWTNPVAIEMKRKKASMTSENQRSGLKTLNEAGIQTVVCKVVMQRLSLLSITWGLMTEVGTLDCLTKTVKAFTARRWWDWWLGGRDKPAPNLYISEVVRIMHGQMAKNDKQ